MNTPEFLLTLRLLRRPEAGAGAYLGAGLVVAAAFLCKYPSAAIAAACVFLGAAAWRVPGVRWPAVSATTSSSSSSFTVSGPRCAGTVGSGASA